MNAVQIPNIEIDSSMVIAKRDHPVRIELESQIQTGFAQAFDASIHEFYPLLSRLNTAKGVCLLGLRLANAEPLFSESYLDQPIEHFLPNGCGRNEVAELGNLYSTHRSATIAQFIVTASALIKVGVHYLAFTGTQQVRNLMQLLQVPLVELGDADPLKVATAKDYGRYYEASPKMCVVDLREAQQTIERVALFSKMAAQLTYQIDMLAEGLSA